MHKDEFFMRRAIALSKSAVAHGNEPFGAVLVKDGEIVFENENQIYTKHDPTYHGEAGLIRDFCAQTGITDLSKYTLYSSCEPCFMCSGAMVWTKLGRLVYAASNDDFGMPAWKPVIKIDYLFAYPQKGWRVISTQTVQSLLSDHLPIITELEYVKEASKKKY